MGSHLRPIVQHGVEICLNRTVVTYQWLLRAPFGFRRFGTISFASFSCVFQILRKASVARPERRKLRATGQNNHNFEFLLTKKQEQYLFCSCHWREGCPNWLRRSTSCTRRTRTWKWERSPYSCKARAGRPCAPTR